MEELKDENQKMTLAFEQLQRDHEKLKEDEQGKSKKLQEFQLLNEHREQAKQDLKGKEIKVYESSKHPFWLFYLHNFSPFLINKAVTLLQYRFGDTCQDNVQSGVEKISHCTQTCFLHDRGEFALSSVAKPYSNSKSWIWDTSVTSNQ